MISYAFMGLSFIISMFLLILIFLYLGRVYARWVASHAEGHKSGGMQIIQGTIFALLGLLLAFTFSGALTKFDNRRALIVDEANAISTLYLRFDLLPTAYQSEIKAELKKYLDLRIKIYQAIPDARAAKDYYLKSLVSQDKIWKAGIANCAKAENAYSCMLIVPAMNTAFDLANTRIHATRMHPPTFIFIFLVSIVLISSLFVGFTISEKKRFSPLHVILFSFVLSITIFSIIDMEYPRLGFIRVDAFDQVLIELYNSLT